ncbi:DUF1467 family protein [Anaplasma phagocytophilum]|uniref:DUF1467 family protein n=1 Tax=Anaplasma phagocytophilum TaxID=948 RepID=UPI0023DEE09E
MKSCLITRLHDINGVVVIAEALLVFVVTWWIALFISLPINVEMNETEGPVVGCASSAPKRAHLAIKTLIVTATASLLTCLYCYFKYKGYVDKVFAVLYDLAP